VPIMSKVVPFIMAWVTGGKFGTQSYPTSKRGVNRCNSFPRSACNIGARELFTANSIQFRVARMRTQRHPGLGTFPIHWKHPEFDLGAAAQVRSWTGRHCSVHGRMCSSCAQAPASMTDTLTRRHHGLVFLKYPVAGAVVKTTPGPLDRPRACGPSTYAAVGLALSPRPLNRCDRPVRSSDASMGHRRKPSAVADVRGRMVGQAPGSRWTGCSPGLETWQTRSGPLLPSERNALIGLFLGCKTAFEMLRDHPTSLFGRGGRWRLPSGDGSAPPVFLRRRARGPVPRTLAAHQSTVPALGGPVRLLPHGPRLRHVEDWLEYAGGHRSAI